MRCLNLTVVICSHFSIFETLETTVFSLNAAKAKL